MKPLTVLFLFFSTIVFAQTKGIVVDENNKPIPYVSIWVENENIGTTSEENGHFEINVSDKEKNLIFSSLGFEKKIIKAAAAKEVVLKTTAYDLKEIIVSNRKQTKEIEIGQTKSSILQAFDNGPRIDAKFFPYKSSYNKTRFIKQIFILTDSSIDNASIKIHLYSVDADGFPGEELLDKDFIVSLKKGVVKQKIDVSDFNLLLPKNGIFVAYEKLLIANNRIEKKITDPNTKITKSQITYAPFVLYNFIEREFSYTFSGGKWNKQVPEKSGDLSPKMRVYEPVINLKLTN